MTTRAQSRTHYVAVSLGQGLVRVRPGPAERTGGYGARASDDYAQDEADLSAYFGGADATLGLHGTGFEAGPAIGADAKAAALHLAKAQSIEGQEGTRLRRIRPLVEALRIRAPEHWAVAFACWTPHPWPWELAAELRRGTRLDEWETSHGTRIRTAARWEGNRGSLVGLVLTGPRVARLYPARELPYCVRQLAAVAREPDAGRRAAVFTPLREDAEKLVQGALAAYNAIRREMARTESAAKRKVVAGLRAVFG